MYSNRQLGMVICGYGAVSVVIKTISVGTTHAHGHTHGYIPI